MIFLRHLVRIHLSTLVSLCLLGALSACVSAPPILTGVTKCADLVPEEWHEKGIRSADLPVEDTVGQWMAFGIAQTGQLDKANSQTKDSHTIVAKCEERDAALIESMQPKPWWKFW